MKKSKKQFKSWWIIGLLIPFIGIILYYTNKGMDKDTKSNLLTGTVIGFGFWLLLAFSFLIKVNGPAPIEEKEYLVSEWVEDIKGNEPVVTVLGLTTCGYCQNYKPVIERLAQKEGFKLYFFEVDNLPNEDVEDLTSNYEFTEFTNSYPFTYIVKEEKLLSEKTGYKDESSVKQFLTDNGIIK